MLPTSPPASMSVSQILAEFGITAGTTKRISQDLFPLVGGTAGSQCFLGASFSGKSSVSYSTVVGNATDSGRGIAVDSGGNIYITGEYRSTIAVPIYTFGTAPALTGVSMPSPVINDAFVIKWNANGTLAGYSTIAGSGNDVGYSIAVDSSQNIYITGSYSAGIGGVAIKTFGTSPALTGVSMPGTTISDAFVIKWNANGTLAGYSTIAGNGNDIGNSIAIDSSRNIYINGQYTSTGTVPINTFRTAPTSTGVSLPISSAGDVFVIKWIPQ